MKKRSAYDALSKTIEEQGQSTSPVAHTTRQIYRGEVVDIQDPKDQSRIRVYIPELDAELEEKKDQLAWCQYFFASNIQHIPKVGESVAIILENPWRKNSGRWWLGPVFENRTVAIPIDSVALTARSGNTINLLDNGDISIATDTNLARLDDAVTIYFDKEAKECRVAARDIVLESTITAGGSEFSLPYGERLVELLRFILQTMKSHSHPPNAPPTPDFFVQADRYLRDLEDWMLNKNVRTRGE